MKDLTLKNQGNLGEATAILYYTQRGYRVSKPLFENSPYDLIVDGDSGLKRVQVKTSRCKSESGNGKFVVNLRVLGGNRSGTGKVKKMDASEVDLIFVLVEDGRTFEIEAKDVDGKGRVYIG